MGLADRSRRSHVLTIEDCLATMSYLVKLHAGEGRLRRRRHRPTSPTVASAASVELIQNQVRIGLSRMERVVRERMTTQDVEAITPQTLINIRPGRAAIKEFFGTSQLSQFMDQVNPLSGSPTAPPLGARPRWSVARARRLRSPRRPLSHYGRMCPIETPEGPNIGLIGRCVLRARQRVRLHRDARTARSSSGKVTDEIVYLTADEEETVRRRPGQRAARREAASSSDRRASCASQGSSRGLENDLGTPTTVRLHGRLAAPDRLASPRR